MSAEPATTAAVRPPRRPLGGHVALVALLLLPGALTAYLGFNAGGYFPGATGVAALIVLVALALRVGLAARPFAAIGPLAALAALLAVGFAAWTYVSGGWSGAHGRALIELDRALLYAGVLTLAATVPASAARMRLLLAGVAAAMVAICIAGLASRLAPDVFEVGLGPAPARLSFPLTYWNAMGIQAALALLLCIGITTDRGRGRATRIVAAAACPTVGATLLLTLSRGAAAVALVGLVVYALAARERSLPGVLLVVGAATGVAMAAAYRADALTGDAPTTATAVAQGHRVALITLAAAAVAALGRALLLALERRIERVEISRASSACLAAAAAALALVAFLVGGGPGAVSERYDAFVQGSSLPAGSERARLAEAGNNGRLEHWRVALDGARDDRLRGTGAGTYANTWARDRESTFVVSDAHSLYVELLSELGIVGLVLVVVLLAVLLVALVARARGPGRSVYALALATALAWALHAGLDWDWEMPAVTLLLFAAGGLAVARPAGDRAGATEGRRGRPIALALSVGLLALAVTPAMLALSQLRLNESVAALRDGDCTASIAAALQTSRLAGQRAEPLQLLALCDARIGADRLAVRAADAAIDRDRDNWALHYTAALVRGATGRDPRPAARRARRLNPREPLTERAVRAFEPDQRGRWRANARRLPLPLQQRAGAPPTS